MKNLSPDTILNWCLRASLVAIGIAGLAYLLTMSAQCMAAEPVFNSFVGLQSNTNEVDADEDQQLRFQATFPPSQIYQHEYWGQTVDIKGTLGMEGVGYRNLESYPFDFTVPVQAWAEVDVAPWLSIDAGGFHKSNGGGPGGSTSWNDAFLRGNIERQLGPLNIASSFRVFYLIDSESEVYSATRTIGGHDAKWGLESSSRVEWPGYGTLVTDIAVDRYLVGIEFDVLDGEFQPFAYMLNGDAVTMAQPDEFTLGFAGGVTRQFN